MKIYTVGGAVRDQLLGLPVQDRDFVVVGASPQAMLDAGFKPVGQDFPVFLHPKTHEEYALARTERKVAPGYAGFSFHSSPDVTLEQDLQRRDLTVNAMARAEDGTLIDPFGGQADLNARVFRHVSQAFTEDPVRILRVARFAARFADFTVAPETMSLMQSMVAAGEVDALVAERVWQELSRGLMQARPSRMFDVLNESRALQRIAPELRTSTSVDWPGMLDQAARDAAPLTVRFALLTQALSPDQANHVRAPEPSSGTQALTTLCQRLRAPAECRNLAMLTLSDSAVIANAAHASADEQLRLLSRTDAFRKPERFEELIRVVRLIHSNQSPASARETVEDSIASLRDSLEAARAVDSAKLAQAINADPALAPSERGDAIKKAVHDARLRSIEQQQSNCKPSVARVAPSPDSPTRAGFKSQRFWKRLIRAPFAIALALVLGFVDWLWNPLLALIMRLDRFRVIRLLEASISRLPPYPALLAFAIPALLLLPFKFFGLYLIGIGQKVAGLAVFVLAKIVGTALVARIFSLTSPALLSLAWFSRLYNRFKDFKTRLYALVFDHPWIRLVRRLSRRQFERMRRVLASWRQRLKSDD